MIMRALWLGLVLLAMPAFGCESVEHRGQDFTVCAVGPNQTISLHLRDASGQVLGSFRRLQDAVSGDIAFAMNAGMYHADRSPVGLFVDDGKQEMRLVTSDGPGNFGLLPNGVFCLRDTRADVIETRAFNRAQPDCREATQSGPMLVIDGKLHPRFLPNSTFRNIRNGVGTSKDGQRVVFVISETAVTFHEMATLFRDVLNLPNALYFDGKVSRLYAPALGRNDPGLPLGPMVAVIDQDEKAQ